MNVDIKKQMKKLINHKITVNQAAEHLDLPIGEVFLLLKAYKQRRENLGKLHDWLDLAGVLEVLSLLFPCI